MPLFVVIAIDPAPHNMARRDKLRTEHRRFLFANDGMIRFAGAMTDDAGNQKLADTYGIVMGTSHHEPMQRAMNEWSTMQPEGKTQRAKG